MTTNLIKAKDQQIKKQEQALKAKDRALKKYQKAIQKSSQLMEEVHKTLAHQLKITQEIHRTLLPSELPVIPDCEFSFKFQPAQKEGHSKDFYEISPHPRHKSFSLMLSSSASHSLSALLFSARLKMMSRTEQSKPLLPEEFTDQLRIEMQVQSPPPALSLANPNSFNKKDKRAQRTTMDTKAPSFKPRSSLLAKGSLFYALVNQKTYQMFYSLIGDISALVQSAESGQIRSLKKSALSLEQQGKSYKIPLNGRDRLILLSAGVWHTRSPEGKSYALSQLKKILKEEQASSVHDLRNRIFYELKTFAKNQDSRSDQSVLVMEVQSRILKLATLE